MKVFTAVLRVRSGSGNIMLSGKSRPHPNNQESNTLLWPVDSRFWLVTSLMLMGHCRCISTHISSISPSSFPRDHGWSRCSKSLLCQAYHPVLSFKIGTVLYDLCLSLGNDSAPGGIAQIPAWVYFKASSSLHCSIWELAHFSLPSHWESTDHTFSHVLNPSPPTSLSSGIWWTMFI